MNQPVVRAREARFMPLAFPFWETSKFRRLALAQSLLDHCLDRATSLRKTIASESRVFVKRRQNDSHPSDQTCLKLRVRKVSSSLFRQCFPKVSPPARVENICYFRRGGRRNFRRKVSREYRGTFANKISEGEITDCMIYPGKLIRLKLFRSANITGIDFVR